MVTAKQAAKIAMRHTAQKIKSEKKFEKERIAEIKEQAEKLFNELNVEVEKAASRGFLSLSIAYEQRFTGNFYGQKFKNSILPLAIKKLEKQGFVVVIKEDKLEMIDYSSHEPWLGKFIIEICWEK